ncbi:hypothetical protein [Nannocystis pusilla]|uniref:hypothetical protein n=1 Tax=Nannocystis pusilla TaxID=889268 RepID=UPI003DA46A2B
MDSDFEARRARAGRCTQIAAGLAGAHLLLWLVLAPGLRDAGVSSRAARWDLRRHALSGMS